MCFDGCFRLCQRLAANDPTLTVVNLNHQCMGNEGAKCVARALQGNTTVVVLFLEDNLLRRTTGLQALYDACRCHPRLAHLYLSHNNLADPEACRILAAWMYEAPALQVIKLEACEIGPTGAAFLSRALGKLPVSSHLQYLSLQNNRLGVTGVVEMSRGLHRNTSLRTLDLRGNKVPLALMSTRSSRCLRVLQAWHDILKRDNTTLGVLLLWQRHELRAILDCNDRGGSQNDKSIASAQAKLDFYLDWNRAGRRSLLWENEQDHPNNNNNKASWSRIPICHVLANAASCRATPTVVMATIQTRPDLLELQR